VDVLIVVDPADERRASAVRLVSDLLEALTDDSWASTPGRYVVLADPNDCLDIGLSTLGKGDPRTVEGGERQASPLTLIPVRARDEDGLSLLARGDDDESGGSLHDLVAAGAIEEDSEWAIGSQLRSLVDAAVALSNRKAFSSIFVLAATSETLRALREHKEYKNSTWHDFREESLRARIREGETAGDRIRREIMDRPPEFEDKQEQGAAEQGIFEACLLTAAIDRLVAEEPRARSL